MPRTSLAATRESRPAKNASYESERGEGTDLDYVACAYLG